MAESPVADPKHAIATDSRLDLPVKLEFDQWIRWTFELAANQVPSCTRVDARLARPLGIGRNRYHRSEPNAATAFPNSGTHTALRAPPTRKAFSPSCGAAKEEAQAETPIAATNSRFHASNK